MFTALPHLRYTTIAIGSSRLLVSRRFTAFTFPSLRVPVTIRPHRIPSTSSTSYGASSSSPFLPFPPPISYLSRPTSATLSRDLSFSNRSHNSPLSIPFSFVPSFLHFLLFLLRVREWCSRMRAYVDSATSEIKRCEKRCTVTMTVSRSNPFFALPSSFPFPTTTVVQRADLRTLPYHVSRFLCLPSRNPCKY